MKLLQFSTSLQYLNKIIILLLYTECVCIYIYITETFETLTIFHVSTIFN